MRRAIRNQLYVQPDLDGREELPEFDLGSQGVWLLNSTIETSTYKNTQMRRPAVTRLTLRSRMQEHRELLSAQAVQKLSLDHR